MVSDTGEMSIQLNLCSTIDFVQGFYYIICIQGELYCCAVK